MIVTKQQPRQGCIGLDMTEEEKLELVSLVLKILTTMI